MADLSEVQDRRRIRRVSDERILDAATEVFAAAGYTGAAMQAIADRAATTKATIYTNFADKSLLYEAAVQRAALTLRGALLATYAEVDDEPVPAQLRAGIGAIFSFAAAHPAGFRLLLGGSAADAPSALITGVYAEVHAAVAAMIEPRLARAGVSNPHAGELLAKILVSICRTAATAAVLDSDMDPTAAAAIAETAAAGAVAGLDLNQLAAL